MTGAAACGPSTSTMSGSSVTTGRDVFLAFGGRRFADQGAVGFAED